jgi:hypothetical protein
MKLCSQVHNCVLKSEEPWVRLFQWQGPKVRSHQSCVTWCWFLITNSQWITLQYIWDWDMVEGPTLAQTQRVGFFPHVSNCQWFWKMGWVGCHSKMASMFIQISLGIVKKNSDRAVRTSEGSSVSTEVPLSDFLRVHFKSKICSNEEYTTWSAAAEMRNACFKEMVTFVTVGICLHSFSTKSSSPPCMLNALTNFILVC